MNRNDVNILDRILLEFRTDLMKKCQKSRSNHWLWPTVDFWKSEKKKSLKYYKIIYSETIEKMEIIDIKFLIFREELDLLWIIEN